tara:strand:+ start:5083 stop:6306 length:1224 start_codon:yes stop_codon:yes gene_type:complete
MNCHEKFSEEFLYDNFPKNYINKDIKELKQNLLFEQEKQLLPASQEIAKYAEHIENVEKSIEEDVKMIYELRMKSMSLQCELEKKKNLVQNFNRDYTIPTNQNEYSSSLSSSKEINVFIKQCPCNDCSGYLSTQWKCGMCNVRVCKDCLEIKGEDHVCNPDNIATANVIKESTKSCPSCGTAIGKIYGCNHMWCTNCNTGFDWRTRKLVIKNNTNPHYYEWLRQNGNNARELSDVVCGGIPNISTLRHIITITNYNSNDNSLDISKKVLEFHRLINHVQHIELRETDEVNNIDLRVKLLRKKITIEKFKQLILTRVKIQRNKTNKQMIFQTLRDAGSDILQRLIEKKEKNYNSLYYTYIEIQNLINYINYAFEILTKKFKCSSYCIILRKSRYGNREEYTIEPYTAK